MAADFNDLPKFRRMYKVLPGDVRLIALSGAAGVSTSETDRSAVAANEALEQVVRLMYIEREENPDKFFGYLSTPEGTRDLADRATAEWKKSIIADHFGDRDVLEKAAATGICISNVGDIDKFHIRINVMLVFPFDPPVMITFSTDGGFEDYRENGYLWMVDPDVYV